MINFEQIEQIIYENWFGIIICLLIEAVLFGVYKAYKKTKNYFRCLCEDKDKNKKQAEQAFKKAKSEFNNKNYDLALDSFSDAESKGYDKNDCQYYQGRIYLVKEKYYEAVNIFENILKQKSNYYDALFYNSVTKQIIGDYKNADNNFKEYLNSIDNSEAIRKIVSHYEYGITQGKLGNTSQAQYYCNKARQDVFNS